jgi:hypothetical protein
MALQAVASRGGGAQTDFSRVLDDAITQLKAAPSIKPGSQEAAKNPSRAKAEKPIRE